MCQYHVEGIKQEQLPLASMASTWEVATADEVGGGTAEGRLAAAVGSSGCDACATGDGGSLRTMYSEIPHGATSRP